jgi:hypothetical protein
VSGWRWELEAPTVPAVDVIEPTPRQHKARKQRDKRRRDEGAKREPFGFARAIPKELRS